MWYCSGTAWLRVEGRLEHTYDIKYASSPDGIRWLPAGEAVIPQKSAEEALTRPWVLHRDGTYHMWFCHRGSVDFRGGVGSYRMGYAESADRVSWRRRDEEAGVVPSREGWDANMVAYPALAETGESTYLFYNGGDFGAAGFGVSSLIGER